MSESLEDVVRTLVTNQATLETKMGAMADNMSVLAKSVHGIQERLHSQPKVETTETRLKLIGGTVAIYTAIMGIANGWFDARVLPLAQTVSRLEQTVDVRDIAVMKYRLSLLEKTPHSAPSN